MAVGLTTLKLLATKSVSGECCSFKTIPDVAQVGDPPQVDRNCIKTDKEAGEQQEGHGHYWGKEDTVLKQKCNIFIHLI